MTNAGLDQHHVLFSVNRLSLNVTKINYMFFGESPVDISVKLNKETINRMSLNFWVL